MRWLRQTGAVVLGWILVIAGPILMPLPGPGMLILITGVALLAPHYHWARRLRDALRGRSLEAAKQSVQSPLRVAVSSSGAVALFGLGVLWLISPTIPVVELAGVQIGPQLPGGRAVGVGLVTSGVVASLFLVYSIWRWYPRRSD